MVLKKTIEQQKAQRLSNLKFRLNLHKAYFDKGFGITSYFKYLIIIFGGYSFQQNISLMITFYVSLAYAVFCYFFGWYWFNFGWYEQEIEVGNQFNCFVKEMRKVYK